MKMIKKTVRTYSTIKNIAKGEIELAYLARKFRLVHPRGTFDGAGRWWADKAQEGGEPDVRYPSRAWPYSHLKACRTKKWCRQLPDVTRKEDAEVAKNAILAGVLVRNETGLFVIDDTLTVKPGAVIRD